MCENFKIFKFTSRSCEIQTNEGCALPSQDHSGCGCCANHNAPCCAECHWMFWPFTIILDVISCGPRFCYHNCKSQSVETQT